MRLMVSAAAVALIAPIAAQAQSETSAAAEFYADGGYSTNPQGSGGDQASAFARVGIRPAVKIRSARSTIDLTGDAQVYNYFRNGTRDDNYTARAALTNAFSEAAGANLALEFTDRVLNRFGDLTGDSTVPNGDAALLGSRVRRRTYSADGGISLRTSSRSTLTAGANWNKGTYTRSTLGLSDYDSYGASLGYNVQTSERLTLGAQAYYSRSTYTSVLFPDSNAYGGAATFKLKLDPRWTLNGELGATVRDLSGNSKNDVFLTGKAELCNAGERTTLCFRASRAVGSSGIAGSAVQTLVGGTLAVRTSERGRLSAGVTYTRSEQSTTAIGSYEYVNGNAGYDVQLSKRMRVGATAFYRKAMGALNRGDDYGGQLGIQYRVGDLR